MIWKLIGSAAIIALMGIAPRPHEIRTGFERVRVAQRFDCPQRAATELAHLAEQLPRRDDLWESAGHHAMAGDSPEDAIEYFETAAANGNLTPDGYLALGDAYHQSGELNAATQTWEAINASHLPSAEILNRLTETYLARDNYAKAIVSLENLLNLQEIIIRGRLPVINSRSSENSVYYVLGLLLAAHNPESAPVYLLRAAKSDSENASQSSQLAHTIQRAQLKDAPSYTLLAVGQELAAKNQWELAAHAFWRATQLRPDYAEAWAYLGEANQHLDETPAEAGLVELKKAIEQNPESLAANTFFAIYWQRKGDIEEAQEYLLTAASLDPSNPALQIYVGELWAQQGDLTAAQSHYQKALELDTHSAATLQALVEFSIRYNLDLRATALPAARQAVLLAPDDPASLDVMGQILFRLGDSLNAKRFWLRALEEDAVYAPTHLHLGLCYIFQDQPDLAREHLAMAISLAPDSAIAAHAQRLLEDFP